MKRLSVLSKVFCVAFLCLVVCDAALAIPLITSNNVNGHVNASPFLTLYLSPTTIVLGQDFNLTAILNTATGNQTAAYNRTITFYENNIYDNSSSLIGLVPTDSLGSATLMFHPTTIGDYTFNATCPLFSP